MVVPTSQERPFSISSATKKQITVMACTSAAGYALPPFVVFDRKTLNVGWTVGEVPGTSYGLSDNGWMNGELFMGWFIDHFLKLAPQARPLLLLLDGHSSHYNPVVIRKAMEEGVIIFCLPPNTCTTHITQPLDRTVFAVLKHEWNRECHHFVTASKGEIVSRANFSRLFGQAWARAMSVKNVTAGFKATGVYPLDRTAIKLPGEEPKEAVPSRHSAIKFVPFFTPSRRQLLTPAGPSHVCQPSPHGMQGSPKTQSSLHMTPAGRPEFEFTEEEERRFKLRYENNYDFTNDPLYNRWLHEYHPESVIMTSKMPSLKTKQMHLLPPAPPDQPSATRVQGLQPCPSIPGYQFPLSGFEI